MVELSRSFELECEIIDRDHKHMVELINDIIAAIDGERSQECARLGPEFVKFAKQHFVREEALLADIGYPNVKGHREHHARLDDKMDTILQLATTADGNPLSAEKLKKELVYFLMDDVINADLDFKAFVEERAGEAGD